MYAGTLTRIDPLEEPLSNWFQDDSLPGLAVETTQYDLGNSRPIQEGTAAGYTLASTPDIGVEYDADSTAAGITVDREETQQRVATEWVADVTETGLIVPESTASDDRMAFPLDLFLNVVGQVPERQHVAIDELFGDWQQAGQLGDVWLNAADTVDSTRLNYHRSASDTDTPSIGLGFERAFRGTTVRGVIYESGYVACYDVPTASEFVRFVDEKILPYCEPRDDDAQATLGEASGSEPCRECGRDTDTNNDGLCLVCHDHAEDNEVNADA